MRSVIEIRQGDMKFEKIDQIAMMANEWLYQAWTAEMLMKWDHFIDQVAERENEWKHVEKVQRMVRLMGNVPSPDSLSRLKYKEHPPTE